MSKVKKISKSEYDALRSLWCKTFDDEPSDVDEFYANWGDDIEGYVLEDDGYVASALTLFRMGDLVIPKSGGRSDDCKLEGEHGEAYSPADYTEAPNHIPAYVSYAICTDPAARGKGFGSDITKFARDVVVERGGASLLSPAEPSLVKFYQPLGYEPMFTAATREIVCETDAVSSMEMRLSVDTQESDAEETQLDAVKRIGAEEPQIGEVKRIGARVSLSNGEQEVYVQRISAEEYNSLREELLRDIAHIRLNEATMRYVGLCSDGLYSINDGQIIIATEAGTSRFTEVIFSNRVTASEVDNAVALLGKALGKNIVHYRTPVVIGGLEQFEKCEDCVKGTDVTKAVRGEYVQAMIAGAGVLSDGCAKNSDERRDWGFENGYFGFAFD